jgi:undecaprenyl-diphosphatase
MSAFSQTLNLAWRDVTCLFGPPAHSHRFDARRRLARHWLWTVMLGGAVIVALMVLVDVPEIRLMPPRGTASLWPVRVITDFGKSNYVLMTLGLGTCLVFVSSVFVQSAARTRMLALSGRFAFLFLAVLIPNVVGEILKGVIGRGRPFVGGAPDAFHYSHFAWTEAYASFPSGHAVTAFALAFALASLAPKWRVTIWAYAVLIAITRLVLLAHHPSDVLAGALVGVLGAMAVRYWFAARHLIFTIEPDGAIRATRDGPASG